MLNRLDVWLQENQIMCELQGAFVSRCSSIDVSALLQETVSHFTERGESVYIVLMDVAKAFDSVWSEGLLYKLFNLGIEGRFWRILKSCYEGFKCNVWVNNQMSGELDVERGVHQGAPLSMRLYQLYNNDLLTELSQSQLCVCTLDLRTGVSGFADDVAIIALFKYCMNALLEVARKHSVKWRYNYNAGKFQALCFGKDVAPDQILQFDDRELILKPSTKHMGVPLCTNRLEMKKHIIERCEKVKKQVRVMMSLGGASLPMPPTLGSKIYKTACAPRLMYGLEGCYVDKAAIDELEKAQRHSAKAIQCMPRQIPNPVPQATLGWLSAEATLDINKMVFLYHWLTLPIVCIYKRMAILRLVMFIYGEKRRHEGPLFQAYCTVMKYGIESFVVDALEYGNTITLKQFKKLAWRAVTEREYSKWEATVLLYRGIKLFRECFPRTQVCIWWKVSYCRPRLCKATQAILWLICGKYSMHGDQGQTLNPSRRCPLCEEYDADNVPHLLFVCTYFSGLRDSLWDNVLDKMPMPMRQHVLGLNVEDRTRFILSGFNAKFTREWLDLYGAIAIFAHCLYVKKLCAHINVM